MFEYNEIINIIINQYMSIKWISFQIFEIDYLINLYIVYLNIKIIKKIQRF